MASTEVEVHHFYASSTGASIEAKIEQPLKTFAYGVPPHTFIDYYLQMSKGLAATCCKIFAVVMKLMYDEEYLHIPDALDLKRIIELHKECHGMNGMFASLDCMHTAWKNCPKGWQASFKSGTETCAGSPWCLKCWQTIIYGSDMHYLAKQDCIVKLLPLLELLVDGSFTELEQSIRFVPFKVAGNLFHCLFALVDGIFPPHSQSPKRWYCLAAGRKERH